MISLQMIAKSGPGMLIGGGVLLLVLSYTLEIAAKGVGWGLVILGSILSLAWAGFFRRLF